MSAAACWGGEISSPSVGRPRQMTSVVRSDPRTGKLVRSMVVDAKPAGERPVAQKPAAPPVVTTPPADVEEIVQQIARAQSLRPELIHSVIQVESNYNRFAVSPKGAKGMMQLIPETARRFGVADVFNPVDNIQGGAKYLRYLLDLYGGNYPLALAAYNAGERAVARYGTVPPYAETQNYLKLVARRLEASKRAPAPKPGEEKAQTAEAKSDGATHVQEIVEADGTVRYVSR